MRAGSRPFKMTATRSGRRLLQVRQHEIVPALFLRRLDDRSAPFLGTVSDPIQELIANLGQGPVCHSLAAAVGVEEAQHSFGLLEGLNEPVQQEPVEAAIPELNAILGVLVKGVHGNSRG